MIGLSCLTGYITVSLLAVILAIRSAAYAPLLDDDYNEIPQEGPDKATLGLLKLFVPAFLVSLVLTIIPLLIK